MCDMDVCRPCSLSVGELRKCRVTLIFVFSDTSGSPRAHFQGKMFGKLSPDHGLGLPLGHHTLPPPFFPFSPIHSPLLLRQARVGQGQPCSAQLPQTQEPGQIRAPGSGSSSMPLSLLHTCHIHKWGLADSPFLAAPGGWEC